VAMFFDIHAKTREKEERQVHHGLRVNDQRSTVYAQRSTVNGQLSTVTDSAIKPLATLAIPTDGVSPPPPRRNTHTHTHAHTHTHINGWEWVLPWLEKWISRT
jgi:hypothetical protein